MKESPVLYPARAVALLISASVSCSTVRLKHREEHTGGILSTGDVKACMFMLEYVRVFIPESSEWNCKVSF